MSDQNPADKIRIAKEAAEMGRRLRLPKGLSPNPTCREALEVAIETLEYYRTSNPIAEWCKRALT